MSEKNEHTTMSNQSTKELLKSYNLLKGNVKVCKERLSIAETQAKQIERGLELLSPDERYIIEHRYFKGKSVDDIVFDINKERSVVYRDLKQGLTKLSIYFFGTEVLK